MRILPVAASERAPSLWALSSLMAMFLASVGTATADVIVLANRAGTPLAVQIVPESGVTPQQITLPTGDSTPVFVDGGASVLFLSAGQRQQQDLCANCAYFFGRTADGRISLQKIGLDEDETTLQGRPLLGTTSRVPSVAIPVKILVDEEEPARQVLWERRLRHRVEAASAILDKHCRVRLQVVAVETWNSDNATTDFFQSLAEFEREVKPSPARVAIGFSSQFQLLRGRVHMAGTRGPLHSHILLREFSRQISEPERLEFLVHELGHLLGASHSPEPTSVMRPVLGDDLAGRADFEVRFDPVNTLTMSIVGEEMRRRNIHHFTELTPGSRRRLRQIYGQLSKSLPDDPAGAIFLALTNPATSSTPTTQDAAALISGTRHVLVRISQAAKSNQALPDSTGPNSGGAGTTTPGSVPAGQSATGTRRVDDKLTEFYVRQAATAADALPRNVGPTAFLLAVGIAMDDSGALSILPNTAQIVQAVETPIEHAARVGSFGKPTMFGRPDLAKHFTLSACLTAMIGAGTARTAGLTKEMIDAQGRSGFSFADIAANQAGSLFAEHVMKKRFSLTMVAGSFSVSVVMPSVDGLPEGLSARDLATQFGSTSDNRFRQQLLDVEQRVLRLPPYRVATGLPVR
ncbi:MAG: hypothetical protein L0Z07_10095 [Planctomycetes bacterium]|nr:hypothetical protein [Planctomycetota bacterium]